MEMTILPLAVVNYRWETRWQLTAAGTQQLLTTAEAFPPKTSNPCLTYSFITFLIPKPYPKKILISNFLCQNHASKSLMIDC
jgi:hypothetical protein